MPATAMRCRSRSIRASTPSCSWRRSMRARSRPRPRACARSSTSLNGCGSCAADLPLVEVPGIFLARAEADRALSRAAAGVLDNDHPVVVPKGAVSSRQAAGAPGTVILKIPSQYPENRAVGDHFDFYQREGRFYEQLARHNTALVVADTLPVQMDLMKKGLSLGQVGQRPFEMGYKAPSVMIALIEGTLQPPPGREVEMEEQRDHDQADQDPADPAGGNVDHRHEEAEEKDGGAEIPLENQDADAD